MERTPLLPLPEGMFIDQIQEAEASLTITVIATYPTACCPLCVELSSSIHSHYRRTVADVPCGGRQVQLLLTVRTFFCRNFLCERKVFDLSASTVRPALGQENDPTLPLTAIHWSGHLWKRWCPAGCSLRDPLHSSEHLTPDYGSATSSSLLGSPIRKRRFFLICAVNGSEPSLSTWRATAR
jgi:hypothetical protein